MKIGRHKTPKCECGYREGCKLHNEIRMTVGHLPTCPLKTRWNKTVEKACPSEIGEWCKNKEHPKDCFRKEYCDGCGISTCSPNFAYHICVEKSCEKDKSGESTCTGVTSDESSQSDIAEKEGVHTPSAHLVERTLKEIFPNGYSNGMMRAGIKIYQRTRAECEKEIKWRDEMLQVARKKDKEFEDKIESLSSKLEEKEEEIKKIHEDYHEQRNSRPTKAEKALQDGWDLYQEAEQKLALAKTEKHTCDGCGKKLKAKFCIGCEKEYRKTKKWKQSHNKASKKYYQRNKEKIIEKRQKNREVERTKKYDNSIKPLRLGKLKALKEVLER